MIFVLLLSLLAILAYEYWFQSRDLFHPIIIIVGVFCFSTAFATANYQSWGDISSITYWVIVIGVISFIVGSSMAEKIAIKFTRSNDSQYMEPKHKYIKMDINPMVTVVVIFAMTLITVFDYIDIRALSGNLLSGFIKVALESRNVIYNGKSISHSVIVLQGLYVSRMLAYIYICFVIPQSDHETKK